MTYFGRYIVGDGTEPIRCVEYGICGPRVRQKKIRPRVMKYIDRRPYADAEDAMMKLLEYANAVELIHDGRIYIEKINEPFLFEAKGSPAVYSAGLKLAVQRGLLELHESGTFVKLTEKGVALFA